jgi:hypothetical protein
MSPNKPNIDNAKFVFDFYDQTVFVAGDVKAHSVVGQDTGMTIIRFYIRRRFPFSQFGRFVPRLERLFGIRMFFPELSECTLGNDSHEENILCSRIGINLIWQKTSIAIASGFWDGQLNQAPTTQKKKPKRSQQGRCIYYYRAVAVEYEDNMLWFWIGSHADYDKLLGSLHRI